MSAVRTRAVAFGQARSTDGDLLAGLAEGDLRPLGVLFDRHEVGLRRYFARMGVASADVDDLVQLTFLDVLRSAHRFDAQLGARAWIFGIASVIHRRHRRSVRRLAAKLLGWAASVDTQTAPDGQVEADQATHTIHATLERMSPAKREVFLLVTFEGLTGAEVAAALRLPMNTVWTRLHHARREIRSALEVAGR